MTVRMASLLTLKGMEIKSVIYPYTNLCVDTLNSKYNETHAKSYNHVKEVKGHGNTKFILHKFQPMAYRTSLNKKYYNSGDFIVVDFDDEDFYLSSR